MADSRNDLLGELAADAALERTDFLVQAADQLNRFLEVNRERIAEIGGLTLIDEDPDYLSVAQDLSFRSRSRYLDEETGEWQSETEVIETAGELVELYNPADIYQAFAEAAREAAGLPPEPTAAEGMLEAAGISPEETVSPENPYAEAADQWAAEQAAGAPADDADAARRLYDLALTFLERSQRAEAHLIEQFEGAAGQAAERLGDFLVTEDADERLILERTGSFRAEVVPEEGEGEWRTLTSPEDLVQFYDSTDVFSDLADALAEAYPEIAPELAGEESEESEESEEEGDAGDDEDDGHHKNGTGA